MKITAKKSKKQGEFFALRNKYITNQSSFSQIPGSPIAYWISEQFKKSFGKKYENYCVSRIYHLLQREDVQIVTQQVLQRGNKKRAMADLYFPQINVWVEVDERHHAAQRKEDEKRTEEENEIEANKKLSGLISR